MPILEQIYIYPVKSLGGFPVDAWPVARTGLLYDRKWMLVDAEGQFLSQRRLPRMALLHALIAGEALRLSTAGAADLVLPLRAAEDAPEVEVTVWGDRCLAKHVSAEADAWLSRALDFPCRLALQPDDDLRQVDLNYAASGDMTAFSDGFPMLLTSTPSLDALNAAMGLNLSMLRFRPNLVAGDCAAYAEDLWRRVRIGDITFRLPKPCSRCAVPTIDPVTASGGKEPLTTLSRLRQWNKKVYFGQNLIHDAEGMLQCGAPIEVLDTGAPQPPIN